MSEREPRSDERDWRRAARRRFLLCAAVLVVGIALAALSDDLLVLGIGVIAVSLVVAMCLLFLEVGYSEDRARAREQRPPTRPPPPAPKARPKFPRRPPGMRPRR